MPLLKPRCLIIALHLLPDTRQDLSGIVEKLPHIGPYRLFEPPGGNVGGVATRSTEVPRSELVCASIVRVLLSPRHGRFPGATTLTDRAGDEPGQEVLAVRASPGVAPVLLQACQCSLLEFGCDYLRDFLLYDLSGRELDLIHTAVGRLTGDEAEGWLPPLRCGCLGRGILPARRPNPQGVETLCLCVEGRTASYVGKYLPDYLGLLLDYLQPPVL